MSGPVWILNGRSYKTVDGLSRALFADCGCDSHSMVHPVSRRITCTKGRGPEVVVAQYIVSAPKLGEAMTVVRAQEGGAVMNAYEQKQEARRSRLEARAEALRAESERRFNVAHRIGQAIPFGQPILVGHHSERHHRADLKRIDNNMRAGVEASKAANDAASRAASVGSGGISSDDPDAITKLEAELAQLEAQQAHAKAINAAHARYLKDPASLDGSELTDADKARIRAYTPAYSWEPHPVPPYRLTNNGANIRRIKQRIEQLKAASVNSGAEPKEHDCGAFKVVENFADNRLQLIFPGKPSQAVRSVLKSRGFRWSPLAGAWQRHLSGCSAEFVTGYLAGEIAKAAQS